MLLLLNANDDDNDVVAPVDHMFIQTDVTELHVTDSGCICVIVTLYFVY